MMVGCAANCPNVTHPVATILGMSCNPVTYAANSTSSVIKSTANSNLDSLVSFVSTPLHTAAAVRIAPLTELACLHKPPLYWQCSVSARANEFPSIFDALIDHSSSTVLISEEYVLKLGLTCINTSLNLIRLSLQ